MLAGNSPINDMDVFRFQVNISKYWYNMKYIYIFKQVDCKRGPKSDKVGFSELMMELREAFDKEGFLLSAAVSPNRAVIDAGT